MKKCLFILILMPLLSYSSEEPLVCTDKHFNIFYQELTYYKKQLMHAKSRNVPHNFARHVSDSAPQLLYTYAMGCDMEKLYVLYDNVGNQYGTTVLLETYLWSIETGNTHLLESLLKLSHVSAESKFSDVTAEQENTSLWKIAKSIYAGNRNHKSIGAAYQAIKDAERKKID